MPQEYIVEPDDSIDLGELLSNLIEYKWVLLAVTTLVTGFALLYAYTAVPIYSADALVKVRDSQGAKLRALSDALAPSGAPSSIVGEMETIRARSTLGRAVDSLGIHTNIEVVNRFPLVGDWLSELLPRDDSELVVPPFGLTQFSWGGEILKLAEFDLPEAYLGRTFTLVAIEGGRWDLFDAMGARVLSGAVGETARGQEAQAGVVVAVQTLRARPGTRFEVTRHSSQLRARQLATKLKVAESQRQSGVIRLSFEDPDAFFARDVVNAIASAYVERDFMERAEEADRSLAFLDAQLPRLKSELERAEDRLNAYRSRTRSVDVSSEARELTGFAVDFERRRVELELRQRELLARFEPEHPQVQAITRQLAGLESEGARLTQRIVRLPASQQDYLRLSRDVEVNNQLYVSLLNTSQQLRLVRAGTVAGVSVIDEAITPDVPIWPRKSLVAGVGLVAGILAGLLAAQGAAVLMRRVRDPRRLERTTGVAIGAILPFVPEEATASSHSPFLLSQSRPDHAAVEALRSLRIHVQLALGEGNSSRVVLVTSAVPGQGKTFVSSNLAMLLANAGNRVLLVDGDLRRPSVPRAFLVPKGHPGLGDLLKLRDSPADYAPNIIWNIFPNLSVMPAGSRPGLASELLSSDRLPELVAWAQKEFDYVVIDAPPILPVVDSLLLAQLAGEVLFVARERGVSEGDAVEAIDLLRRRGVAKLSLVYNCHVPSVLKYGYGGYYRYGGYRYRQYGAGPAYGDTTALAALDQTDQAVRAKLPGN